ncbi:protein TASOR isoform X2 [Halichoeres trimaculatus]|uniref:protein TASOR isoform X2 n=1 Tax=Halichoeres trimaculatus TaxID=147232 RepID=UPI003D9EE570
MGDNPARRAAARPRRVSAAAELGANVSPQDGEGMEVHPSRETQPGPDRLGAAAGRMDRRNSAPQPVHQRHMPIDPLKFHIPRKTKEKRALFHHVSTESREYEDMMTILTSSFIDTSSAGSFTYSKPRLVQSELLEKEFVEKRKEMKADGRTDKELEESYCFLLADSLKTPLLCEKGLLVGHSRVTVLGNPTKGVYLSRYSDLLQSTPITPGFTGEIIIFKVMKGKIKSIYENMKNLLDPTPRFDSHISKNISKVTSISSYRAFELTQHYFYEYSFDELRPRPRQVCPYAVLSFQFKGKDSALPSKPLAPLRSNSQSADGGKERAQFTVWNGDLVKGDRVLYQISLRSFSPPFLPHKLPEKLEIGWLMRLDKLTKLLPSELFSYNLYSSSHQVVKSGHCCSLLEVTDRFCSTTSITKLLHELEKNRVVLVTPLTEKGFLFLISSVQMATPSEREESWKRCLQALFVFPESRDIAKSRRPFSSSHDASLPSMSGGQVMPRLSKFIPALHHALVKARANPPPELSAGVERQAREYLIGLKDGKVRQYPMGEYESTQDDRGTPAPKHHRVNMDGYLRSYLYNPAFYLLSVARARQMVETHCSPEDPREAKRRGSGGQREAGGRDATGNSGGGKNNSERMQQLIDLVMTCKRNAENEVKREEAGRVRAPGRKRKLEQETAERALKFLKASQEHGRPSKFPVEETPGPASNDNLLSVIGSVGLKDVDLREDGSELAAQLVSLLTGLSQAARGTANQSSGDKQEEDLGESFPFDRLASKLGLPTNCDIDLRRQEELEEQTAGSVSSLEGFSPGSHSGEMNHRGGGGGGGAAAGGLRGRGGYEEGEEEWEIPWILIPITGLSSERYTHRDRNLPQDPRFQHLAPPAIITSTTKAQRTSPTLSPEPSPPPSPFKSSSPEPCQPPSPSQCPSPDPSPPTSPFHCPSPDPSPPLSPSQCPSPDPSPPPSPSQCPSPQPSPSPSPSRCKALVQSSELSSFNGKQSAANEEPLASTASGESAGVSKDREERPQGKEETTKDPSSSVHPSVSTSLERRKNFSPHPAEGAQEREDANLSKETETQRGGGGGGGEATGGKQNKEVELIQMGGLISSPPPPPLPPALRGIDTIVDKHLGDFSSEIQRLLQGESIHYSCQQTPHSSSHVDSAALPHLAVSQFSHYVSFHNPCPPVEDYVSSLQDSMSSMLSQFRDGWPSKHANSRTVDAALASTVSAFVSSIRANVETDRDDGGGGEPAEVDSGGEVWPPLTITKQFSDAANRNSPTFHVTLSESTSGPGSGFKPASAPVLPLPPPHALEITRTVVNNIRDTQDGSSRTVQCTSGGENYKVTLSAAPDPAPSSDPAPPPTALSSLISQLQPEVFNSLVEIIKDVKRNSLQFYIHCSEPGEPVYEGIKDQLLQQGNVQQQCPVTFLTQGCPDNRLLVIIKNEDISGHVHEIPGLVSLKRHPSVVFMGIDTPDDVMNNSFNELFVCGGCVVSDEFILNPDYISHERLAAVLQAVEQRSSPESVWRWKIHCKTHKKLKEQARFRRDAATLLDMLSAYQKRQIVEFLPYHHCDTGNNQSPDLQCLLELQSRYTQYRHTVFLTERHCEKLPAYSNVGIVVANIDDILHDFPRLVGDQDVREKLPPGDEGPNKLLHPVASGDQPHPLLHQSGPGLSHLSDQLVPDASCKDGVRDYEILRHAISQLRAERQAQLQELQELERRQQQQRVDSKTVQKGPDLAHTSAQTAPGKNAVAATLDFIHLALQTEEEEEEGAVGALRGNQTPAVTSNQNSDTAQTESANERRDGAASCSTAECPAEGNRSRTSPSDPEPPSRPAGNLSVSADSSTGSIATQTQPENSPQPHSLPGPPQGPNRGAFLLHGARGPTIPPLRSMGGKGGLLGAVPAWTGPIRGPTFAWGLPQTGRDFPRPGLLGEYQSHVQPGGTWSRGGPRGGGGFNRM